MKQTACCATASPEPKSSNLLAKKVKTKQRPGTYSNSISGLLTPPVPRSGMFQRPAQPNSSSLLAQKISIWEFLSASKTAKSSNFLVKKAKMWQFPATVIGNAKIWCLLAPPVPRCGNFPHQRDLEETEGANYNPRKGLSEFAISSLLAAAGPEPPGPGAGGDAGPGAGEGRSGAVAGPGPSADSRVPPAGNAQEALQERYRLGSLLGRGGFGSVFAATRLSDGAPVAIKRVPRDRIRHWGELPDGTSAPLEIVLLAKVSTGCGGVIQLLEWLELPDSFLLVLERPERCQELSGFLAERGFLPEEEARELFRQVLEAVRHCTSCGGLHRDIKPENVLLNLASRQLKLIDFGCGAFLQDTAYTQFAGTQSYSPPEWIQHQRYHGEAATIWSLGLLLCHLVMGKHPFRRGQEIIRGRILFPRWLSQACQDVIKRCLSMQPSDRPSLEELFRHPWVKGVPLP
ncbi:serine/threonine-protein kinase pim-1-like [Ammospiza nelsoni]|uniref:serine/threonine-protein kinase pim-1-like n=1 Tax=Ammospiza nelsoni TaxID=2857394 RepID=UPI00286D2419|nr:serine/threonine-protein kinase pim-1-like [Ammospiza nelsoni]XP_059346541.1 serine/threonine-protein kinase pim-1-like [Ammospiza nelsoni]